MHRPRRRLRSHQPGPSMVLALLLAVLPAGTAARAAAPYAAEPDLLDVVFAEDSRVRLRGGALTDLSTNALRGVDEVLARAGRWEWTRLCDVPEETLDEWQRRAEATKGAPAYNLNNLYRLRLPDGLRSMDIWALATALEDLPGVITARPVPKPMPLPLPPDFQPSQNYEDPAFFVPSGVNAEHAWTLPGGDGTGVTVCDIEYSWNYAHQDVPKALGSQINTNVADPFLDTNHGTAVIGELVSHDNAPNWGTKGVCYGADLKTCGAYYGLPTPSWNPAGAIAVAIAALDMGDIILLEQQWDYTGAGGYVPVEWYTDVWPNPQTKNPVYLAIQAAVDQGIHVVEAGGNGNVDTDTMVWLPGSGAVIVGAGGAYPGGPWPEGDLERLSFSSYGSRYDLHAWGENVVTTGYGDLFSAEGVNRRYTAIFSGTSSASPIVAGAMACIQGYYKNFSGGGVVSPKALRDILVSSGTPQWPTVPGHIGPRPDIFNALLLLPSPTYMDYGDAPEGALAYPDLGVIGNFPTCQGIGGPGTYVSHGPSARVFFGQGVDVEADGNGGVCPPGPADYDNDECGTDADAGLLAPAAYTIDAALNVVPCDSSVTGCLGPTCTTAIWGVNVDLSVTNNSPATMYLNVLMDWNRDGQWFGTTTCSPEQVLSGFPVPPGYSGPLSGLGPPSFTIGPRPGPVWTRFTICESAMPSGWTGNGTFSEGESSDFLLCVSPGPMEYGDAPENAPAYPGSGVIGAFPTCKTIGPSGYVEHASSGLLHLGAFADLELDGNAGLCPSFPPYDADECSDPDAGIVMPQVFSLDPAYNLASCLGAGNPRMAYACRQVFWGVDLDITATNLTGSDAFLNVLADWNRDGIWQGSSPCIGGSAPERVLVNLTIPSGFSGPLVWLLPPPFRAGPLTGFVWMRFTLTDVPIGPVWDGSGSFTDGETSDFLFQVLPDPTGAEVATPALRTRLEPGQPNPFRVQTTVVAELGAAGPIAVDVYDVTGRNVRTLFAGPRDAGRHEFAWDGRDAAGTPVAAGVYFVRLRADGRAFTVPVTRMK